MDTYVLILRWFGVAVATWFTALLLMEAFGRPRKFLCDCRMFSTFPYHLHTIWLLTASILVGAASVSDLALFTLIHHWMSLLWATIEAAWSMYYYRRWKKHNKGGKHGSLAKLLARVKVTSAGLRIIPVKS